MLIYNERLLHLGLIWADGAGVGGLIWAGRAAWDRSSGLGETSAHGVIWAGAKHPPQSFELGHTAPAV